MKSDILYPGAFPVVRVHLAAGESLKAESGAMVSMSPTLDVESKMEGGLFKALSRKVLTGEHFFFQTLRATRGPGEALLAPSVPGEIIILELDGVNEYFVQKDGFLAGAEGLVIESRMQSLARGLLGGEGFFILKIGGRVDLQLHLRRGVHLPLPRPGRRLYPDAQPAELRRLDPAVHADLIGISFISFEVRGSMFKVPRQRSCFLQLRTSNIFPT